MGGPETRVELSAMGLRPDTGESQTAVLQQILTYFRGQAGLRFCFAPGVYHFSLPETNRSGEAFILSAEGFKDTVIDGAGAIFVFSGDAGAIRFRHCENLIFRDFHLSYNERPAVFARIIDFDRRSCELEMNPLRAGWSVEETRLFLGRTERLIAAFAEAGPEPSKPAYGMRRYSVRDEEAVFRSLSARRFRLDLRGAFFPDTMRSDHFMLLKKDFSASAALRFEDCVNVSLENLTAAGLPSDFIEARRCEDMRLSRIRLSEDEGLSAGGAGLIFADGKGELKIEDCTFERQWDEGINVFGAYGEIEGKPEADSLILNPAPGGNGLRMSLKAGDFISFLDPFSLRVKSGGCLKAVLPSRGGRQILRFERPLNERINIGDKAENHSRRVHVTIRDSVFADNYSSALRLNTYKSDVRNCRFSVPGAALCVKGEANSRYESGAFAELDFTDNKVLSCAYCSSISKAPLEILPGPAAGAAHYYHQKLVVARNMFELFDRRVLKASNTAELVMEDNRLSYTDTYPPLEGEAYQLNGVGSFSRLFGL